MRETFKSLSIFSAMLLLLLMISTGCDINIPGCGKRSIPFSKQTAPATTSTNNSVAPAAGNQTPLKNQTTFGSSSSNITTQNVIVFTPTPVVEVEKIAFTTIEENQPTLWTMNTDGTERTRLTPRKTSSWHPLWSPDGKTLGFLSTANDGKVNLYIVAKGSNQLIQLTSWEDMPKPDPNSLQTSFTWSPKSDQIAYIYKNQLWLVQLDTLEQSTLVTVDPTYSISSIAWAPHRDNKYVAYAVRKGINYYSIMLVNPRLKDTLTIGSSAKPISAISWTSGAEKVAYVSDNKAVYTTAVEDTTPKPNYLNPLPNLAPFVAYSPENGGTRMLLLAKQRPEDSGYKVALVDQFAKSDQDTGSLKYLTPAGVTAAVFSPDGTKIAYVISGELWIMDTTTGLYKNRIALTGIQSPDWSKK